MLNTLTKIIIHIDPDDVIEHAQAYDLDVTSIEDFRGMAHHYDYIESMMEDYKTSFARYSALGGLTTGVGGFTTSVTFAGLDTISLAIQLYRLSQRFAILNGFDGSDPLQKDKMLNIYFEALGINGVLQAGLKHQLLKAGAKAETEDISESFFLGLMVRIARIGGKNISSEEAGRLIPVVGGVIGATLNYSFARKTSARMQKAFKRAYFETWQEEHAA